MTTLNLVVTTEANDGSDSAGGLDTRTGTGAGEYFVVGVNTTPTEYGYIRFVGATVPQGTTITSAFLTFDIVTGSISMAANSQFRIVAEAADNSGAITAGHRPLNGWAGDTTAFVDVTSINTVQRKSVDVTTILQELVNRAGWAGAGLTFKLTANGADTYFALRIADFGTTTAAVAGLDITYGAAATVKRLLLLGVS